MANVIKGINTRIPPSVVVNQRVRRSATNLNGGTRVALIMGEGLAEELLVASAYGGGQDGVNSDYSGTTAPTGRHFQLGAIDLVANRSVLRKNGANLTVLEQAIDTDPFDARYDARLDPATGRVELQRSYLVDFGTSNETALYFKKYTSNVGTGVPTITSASLIDPDSAGQSWTIRCISIVVDGYGAPVSGEARFSVTGSVSGAIKSTSGQPITWKSDGVVVSNTILSFAISEGATSFRVGDKFTVQVQSGALIKGDVLEARYIPTASLNDPELFLSPTDLFAKHGSASETNTLSLGATMAFENGAPAVVALQCKPPIPRKTTEVLLSADNPLSTAVEGATGSEFLADTVFAMNPGAKPDADTEVLLFVVDPDGTETQLVLTKVDFYDDAIQGSPTPTTADAFTNFVTVSSNSYTVIEAAQAEQEGSDGYVYADGDGYFHFSAPSVAFSVERVDAGESDLDKLVVVYDLSGNVCKFTIDNIGDGLGDMSVADITFSSGTLLTGTSLRYQIVDPADLSSYVCLTDDVVATYLTAGKGLTVKYVDFKDADFFDTNWGAAFEAAELANAQFVVPLPTQTISNIFAVAKAHVLDMSSVINAKERMLIIGAINGLTANNLTGTEDAAVEDIGTLEGIQGDSAEEVLAGSVEDLANYSITSAYGDTQRVIYMVPDQIVRNIAGTNTTLSGYFAGAAMAGYLSGKSFIPEPPTNKTLAGFTIPRTRVYRPLVLNQLLDAGACVLEPVTGGGRIIHGLTTAQSDAPEDEEISIVEIRDQVVRTMRGTLRPFVGVLNTPTAITAIASSVDKTLRGLVSLGFLTGYADLVVARNPIEPRQVDITVRAFPSGPINWISVDIEFSMQG